MNKYIKVKAKIIKSGLEYTVNGKSYKITYGGKKWEKLNPNIQIALRDNLATAITMHLPLVLEEFQGIEYSTNKPLLEPYFFQNFILDIPSCTETDNINTSEYVKKFLHIDYQYNCQKINYPDNNGIIGKDKAIVAMSFGKDSLLSYALASELKLNPEMVYIVENSFSNEKEQKIKLAEAFKAEFNKELLILEHETSKLRDYSHLGIKKSEFGWGLQNTEYALELIPYAFAFKANVILFGNEQTTSEKYIDSNNKWLVYPCYDQTHNWTIHLDQITKMFSNRTISTTSFIEPLMDIMVQRILQRRYPEIAKYQMSCFVENNREEDNKSDRWCHECVICAKMYLLSTASGMNPRNIGLKENMFNFDKKHLFTIFGNKSNYNYLNSPTARDEQLFAFYLAAKSGIKGELIDLFRESDLYQDAKERNKELMEKFLRIYPSISIPSKFKDQLLNIFEEELEIFRNQLNKEE